MPTLLRLTCAFTLCYRVLVLRTAASAVLQFSARRTVREHRVSYPQRSRLARRPASIHAWTLSGLLFLLLFLGATPSAFAQLAATVSATGAYQYNTNVFDLQRGFLPAPDYYSQIATYYAYGAALNLNDQISQQNLYLRATDTEYKYDHFDLSHNEYALDGGWLWKVGDELNGTLDVSRAHVMVPFLALTTEATQALQLYVSTDQRETATANYQFTPDWAFGVNGYTDRDVEPLEGEPNLRLSDSGAGVALRFGGNGEWRGVLTGDYQHGDYANAILYFSPAYNQWDWGIGGTYQPNGAGSPTVVDFGFGTSSRTSPSGVNDTSAWTGHLNVTRQLTGKTTLKLTLLRDVSSFVAAASAQVDSAAGISAIWQATYKTSFTSSYTFDYTVYPGQGPNFGNRGDHIQYATFAINYLPTRSLTIMPYLNFQTRASNLDGANFNATQYGVSFTVSWQNALAAGAAGH